MSDVYRKGWMKGHSNAIDVEIRLVCGNVAPFMPRYCRHRRWSCASLPYLTFGLLPMKHLGCRRPIAKREGR